MLGNGGVGKTSLAKKYCYNFFPSDQKLTIGVEIAEIGRILDTGNEISKINVVE